MSKLNRTISIAPMMDWTDRHYRHFARLISKHTVLYTEMVTTGALIHADPARFLQYSEAEHPIALQLGGSNLFKGSGSEPFVNDVQHKNSEFIPAFEKF